MEEGNPNFFRRIMFRLDRPLARTDASRRVPMGLERLETRFVQATFGIRGAGFGFAKPMALLKSGERRRPSTQGLPCPPRNLARQEQENVAVFRVGDGKPCVDERLLPMLPKPARRDAPVARNPATPPPMRAVERRFRNRLPTRTRGTRASANPIARL